MSIFVVRTDLALEEGERIRESGVEIHGVILEEETRPETGILVTRVKIETKNGAKIMGKPIGTYVTLEAGQLGNDEEEYQQEVAKELSVQLQKLIPDPETEKIRAGRGAWKPAGDGGCAGIEGGGQTVY